MVGIAVQRVYVRHLDHSHHRQQCQTQQGGCPESAWLPAASLAEIWLQSCEQKHLQIQGYMALDAATVAVVPVSAGLSLHMLD
jgi:flagellar biosynthesis component FlhA